MPTMGRPGLSRLGIVAAFFAASSLTSARAAQGDAQHFTFFQADEFEYRAGDGGDDSFNWDAQGWIGGDYSKLWLKTEGENAVGGHLEGAEVQLLYSRLTSSFFDIQAGLRYDFQPRDQRSFAVLGLQGLAPYYVEVDAAAFLSGEGELSARFEAEYDLLLTQRLVLQPSLETNLALQDVRERGIGSGINDIELGLRLRYEIRREFAPYIGINWERKLGKTADFARDEGEDDDTLSLVAGLRVWF